MKANYPQDVVNSPEDNALTHWRKGELVVIPTETVYGLAADATNDSAVAKIYALKARPRFNPLIVHVPSVAVANRYAQWNPMAETLAAAFWPGPLTLVLQLKPEGGISELVTNAGDTIALRMPNHPLTLQLLAAFGGGVAAPSANRSGRISPTTAQHVRDEFGDACPLLLDGGPCQVGLESTVLDVTGDTPHILRPGSITKEMIFSALGINANVNNDDKPVGKLRSPGQLASHYAPSVPVRLNATHVGANEALLAFGPTPLAGAARSINLSETADLVEAASRLFASLRALDDGSGRPIAVMPIPDIGVGEAMNDRLKRAAADK